MTNSPAIADERINLYPVVPL